jgi:UDP-N-acetylmuramyl pentapeptide synthase
LLGSAGKTSTKEFLARLLGGTAGGVLSTEANLNNHLGVPLTLTRLDPALHRFARG